MKSHPARILYAEDDADTRELITLVLASRNCHVIATESHTEALRLARAEHFDLYLIDNWLPGISAVCRINFSRFSDRLLGNPVCI
jgi:CheY-like chemotaxis protein